MSKRPSKPSTKRLGATLRKRALAIQRAQRILDRRQKVRERAARLRAAKTALPRYIEFLTRNAHSEAEHGGCDAEVSIDGDDDTKELLALLKQWAKRTGFRGCRTYVNGMYDISGDREQSHPVFKIKW